MLLLNCTRELPQLVAPNGSKREPNVNFRKLEAFKVLSEDCTQHAYFLWLLCDAVQQREAKYVNGSSFLWCSLYLFTAAASLQLHFFSFDILSLGLDTRFDLD